MAPQLPNFGPRARKVLRYAGLAVLGIVTFVFAFQATFPFGRVKERIIDALADKYDVTIGDVDGGIWPGRMYLKAMTIRTRPASADEVATTFYIEQLQVDLGLFAMLHGTVAASFDAKIGPGHIKGDVSIAKDETKIAVTGDDLPAISLPMREALGLPMSGKLKFAVRLDLPSNKLKTGKIGPDWTKADGSVELACPSGCAVGDGKSKLRPKLKNARNQAFAEGGIDFGKVNIDTLFAAVELKNGKLDITKFETKSPDGDLHIDFDMTVNQDLNQSQVTGCLRFRGSDVLLKREPKTHAAISTTGAPLGPDNLFQIKLDGPLHDIRRLGQICSGPGAESPTTTARPNLNVIPEPTKPIGGLIGGPPGGLPQVPQPAAAPVPGPGPNDALLQHQPPGSEGEPGQVGPGVVAPGGPVSPPGAPVPPPGGGSAPPGAGSAPPGAGSAPPPVATPGVMTPGPQAPGGPQITP